MSEVIEIHEGDCREVLPTRAESSADSLITDPPYEIGFMGKVWDSSGVAFDPQTWCKALRVLKPGGYAAIFGGTRTHHRIMCAVEDAGFELRDCLMWLYGTGMPKGDGCLKPAWEPIILARKPGKKVLPLGIDACRVPGTVPKVTRGAPGGNFSDDNYKWQEHSESNPSPLGRYPANVLHDGSDEVIKAFDSFGEKTSGVKEGGKYERAEGVHGGGQRRDGIACYADTGSAARFFYCAKASKTERGKANTHPTVKPLALMRWLVRLLTPEAGQVLDPFAGSGTTAIAAARECRRCVLIEREPEYVKIIRARIANACPADLFFRNRRGRVDENQARTAQR